MRRLAPWALVALVLVGAGIGAGVGRAGSPPTTTSATAANAASDWVDTVLATTRAAGSAHLSYTQVTASPNPLIASTMSGSGVVDFATGSARIEEVEERQASSVQPGAPQRPHAPPPANAVLPATAPVPARNVLQMITIGKTSWIRLGGRWIEFGALQSPDSRLGLPAIANATVALGQIDGPEPVVAVRSLGPATVDGVATTRYVVTTARPTPCNAAQAAAMRSDYAGPTTLWVDGQGRLVQARDTTHVDFHVPSALGGKVPSDVPTGPAATTATLHLGDFGIPVHVSAPPAQTQPSGSGSSGALALHRCR